MSDLAASGGGGAAPSTVMVSVGGGGGSADSGGSVGGGGSGGGWGTGVVGGGPLTATPSAVPVSTPVTHADAVAAIFTRLNALSEATAAEIASIKADVSKLPTLLDQNLAAGFASLRSSLTAKSG